MNEEQIIVQYDPDFDAPASADSRGEILQGLGGERAFWAGVVIAVLTLMSLGFVILAIQLLGGKTISL